MDADLKTLHIQYFALLREQSGRSSEIWQTRATNALELYHELRDKNRFSVGKQALQVAINDKFAAWESTLNENDKIVFIPPVAGG